MKKPLTTVEALEVNKTQRVKNEFKNHSMEIGELACRINLGESFRGMWFADEIPCRIWAVRNAQGELIATFPFADGFKAKTQAKNIGGEAILLKEVKDGQL